MPEPRESPQEIWTACLAYGDAVFEVHDRWTWQRDRRREGFAVWRMSVPTGEGLSRTLLSLKLYALSHDAAVTTGRPLTGGEVAGIPLLPAVSEPRQPYELFTGLHAVALDAERSHWVNVLRLLTYERPGSALVLARLDSAVHTTVERLVARYRAPGLTVRDLRQAAGEGPADRSRPYP